MSLIIFLGRGGRAWLNAPVLKTGRSAMASWVRIPPPPPKKFQKRFFIISRDKRIFFYENIVLKLVI